MQIHQDSEWTQFGGFVTRLSNMIMRIHAKEEVDPRSFFTKEEYFQCNNLVFGMVKDSLDDSKLARHLQEEFAEFINTNLRMSLKQLRTQPLLLLKELSQSWSSFGLFRKWISRLFHHYNKNAPLTGDTCAHTDLLAETQFRKQVFLQLRHELIEAVSETLRVVRLAAVGSQADPQDRETRVQLLKTALSLYEDLLPVKSSERSAVFSQLEIRLIDDSRTFFQQRAEAWGQNDCTAYLKLASNLKEAEEDLMARLFEGLESLDFIKNNMAIAFYKVLLEKYCSQLESRELGFPALYLKNDKEALSITYSLYSQKEEFSRLMKAMSQAVADHISLLIEDYIKAKEDQKNLPLVEQLLSFYSKNCSINQECLQNHHEARFELKRAFSKGINPKLGAALQDLSMPKLIATYALNSLTEASRKEEAEVDKDFEYLVDVVGCLDDKDMFLHNLQGLLNRRVLDNDLESIGFLHWEKKLVSALKSSLGPEFCKNLESLLIEAELSQETRQQFKEYMKNGGATSQIDLSVNVLAMSDWVNREGLQVNPCIDLLALQKNFETFFLSRSQNLSKNLSWVYHYGRVELKATLNSKSYTVHCKPYHFFVLSILEECSIRTNSTSQSGVSFEKLKSKLGCSEAHLESILLSFRSKKKQLITLLKQETPLKQQEFGLNLDFVSKTRKVTVKDAKFTEKKKKNDEVVVERSQAIQSALVRLMKSKKEANYLDLVQEVEKLLMKFKPTSRVRLKKLKRPTLLLFCLPLKKEKYLLTPSLDDQGVDHRTNQIGLYRER